MKVLSNLETKGNWLALIKGIHQTLWPAMRCDGETLKSSPCQLGENRKRLAVPTPVTSCSGGPRQYVRQENE